jgi:ribosomal protein S18 acetylase RimI-like enzyme
LAIVYRTFRNPDPPALVQIWNDAMTGRGAAFLQGAVPLEHYVLAKPYFDPRGLIVAEERGALVGFAHAGFGPDETGAPRLARAVGVICMVAVRPGHRRHGIGSELLRRAEAYLRDKGAGTIYGGGMRPFHPFYWGLYGGSELPGFLTSDATAAPFLQARGYTVWDRCVVFQRNLDTGPPLNDPRFPALRRKYELQILPRPVSQRWFEESVLSPFEVLQFHLIDKATRAVVAQAKVWDMDLFVWRWHQPVAGVIDVEVREDCRRQGLAKLLMTQILHYLQDQFFTLAEVQTMERNTAAVNLYQSLGFHQVDTGQVYRRQEEGER